MKLAESDVVGQTVALLLQTVAEDAEHIAHDPADEIVLERYVALLDDILLLGDDAAVDRDAVFPLVAVDVPLAAGTVFAAALEDGERKGGVAQQCPVAG